MQSKQWYSSKVLWFNILALIVAVVSAFGYTGELPADWAIFVPAIIALINMALRLITKEKIAGPVARTLRGE